MVAADAALAAPKASRSRRASSGSGRVGQHADGTLVNLAFIAAHVRVLVEDHWLSVTCKRARVHVYMVHVMKIRQFVRVQWLDVKHVLQNRLNLHSNMQGLRGSLEYLDYTYIRFGSDADDMKVGECG